MTILVLSPHTDDECFGMGGTIAKLTEAGHAVHIAAFSVCMQSVLKHLPADILITEFHAACEVLGVPRERRHINDFKVRTFDRHRQEILDWMIHLREEHRPERVYIPSLRDTHQDHEVVAKEALRAFKYTTVLCYDLPWNCAHFHAQYFEVLTDAHIQRKSQAALCYKSQARRPYARTPFLRGHAITRAIQGGAMTEDEFAEAFEVVRMVSPQMPPMPQMNAQASEARASVTSAPSVEENGASPASALHPMTNDTPGPYTPLPANIER